MKYRIKFSAEDVDVEGKPLEETIEKDVALKMDVMKANGKEADRDILRKISEENNPSKAEGEKRVLQALLRHALEEAKDVSVMYLSATMSAEIKDSNGYWDVDERDFEGHIRKPIEKVKKQPWWINFPELFKQIKSPEEMKEEKSGSTE